jgi:hypothetical protein
LIAIRDKLSAADDAINDIRGREKRLEAYRAWAFFP